MPNLDGTGPSSTGRPGKGIGPCSGKETQSRSSRGENSLKEAVNYPSKVGGGFRRRGCKQ